MNLILFFFLCSNVFPQYSGTNAEFTKADAVIFRSDIYNVTSGRKEFNFKRTLKYDSKWLDSKYCIIMLLFKLVKCICIIIQFILLESIGKVSIEL